MKPAILLALVLLAPVGGAVGEDWRTPRVIEKGEFAAFDAASLNTFDFDGDGWPEIVSSNDNGRVYVLSMKTGRVLARIETTHPDGWNARDINPVSIGDLYGDGVPCLVIPNSAAYLAAWCYDGRTVTGAMDFDKKWEIRVDAAQWDPTFHEERPWLGDQQPSMDGNAFLAEVDGAPGLEIFVETDGYPGQFSFSHTGEHRWHTAHWDGNAGVVVADLDHDGQKEAIFASDAGVVTCYDAASGGIEWTFDAAKNGASPGSITLAPTVADLAGDKKLELVFAARGATAGLDGSHATWFALSAGGSLLWKRSESWMNPLAYTHPAAVDVDGDGRLDVVAMDWNTIGHKPGNWETTARGPTLFALRGSDGAPLWHTSVPSFWSNKDVVILGGLIVANAEVSGNDGLRMFDVKTGKARGAYGLPEGWEAMRGPVAVDADGRVFLVVPLAKRVGEGDLDVGDRQGAIAIVEATGAGELRFSANFLHTDSASVGVVRGLADVPLVLAALAVLGGVGYFGWKRYRSGRGVRT